MRWRAFLCLSFAMVFLSGCGGDGDERTPESLLAPGPFPVGHRVHDVEYTSITGEARSIRVYVWYPSSTEDATPATYAVGGVVSLTASALDAPPIEPGAHPVVVYSHGSRGEGLLGYPYGEHLASHGFVVAAPNHAGNTILDSVLDSSVPFLRSALDRPRDVSAVLDAFESGELAEGQSDPSNSLVVGHSFGGYTALALAGAELDVALQDAACSDEAAGCELLENVDARAAFEAGGLDTRVRAVVPQAPALIRSFEANSLPSLTVPTLLMSGRLDQTTTQSESADPAWAALEETGALWVDMPAGGHFSFVTICDDLTQSILDLFQPGAVDDGCGPDFIPASEAVPVLSAYTLAFALEHLEGDRVVNDVFGGEPLGPGFVIRP